MAELVEPAWVSRHLASSGVIILDSRSFMHYLKGHIRDAVNLPVTRIFDGRTLELLPDFSLAKTLGEAGVSRTTQVLLYDEYDGQGAAMLAWALEYLGHPSVRILSSFFEGWVENGYEVMYKPVAPKARKFQPNPIHSIRAKLQDVSASKAIKLLDVRSREEYAGKEGAEVRGGHIPGAINLPWTELLGTNRQFLRPRDVLKRTFSGVGLSTSDKVVAYCRSGPRATVGFLALKQLGFKNVAVYDGSFLQWARRPDLPVER